MEILPFILVFFVFLFFDTCNSFFARGGKDGNWRTKSHSDITNVGIFQALEGYIIENKGSSSIDNFFSEGRSKYEIQK